MMVRDVLGYLGWISMIAFGIVVWRSPYLARFLGLSESLSGVVALTALGLVVLSWWIVEWSRRSRER